MFENSTASPSLLTSGWFYSLLSQSSACRELIAALKWKTGAGIQGGGPNLNVLQELLSVAWHVEMGLSIKKAGAGVSPCFKSLVAAPLHLDSNSLVEFFTPLSCLQEKWRHISFKFILAVCVFFS